MKSARSDMLKTRRAVLKGFDGTKLTKDLMDSLKRSSAAWTETKERSSTGATPQTQTQRQTPADPPSARDSTPHSNQNFSAHSFKFGALDYSYRVFAPSRTDDSALPMVVMLHGCKQDALDFSNGVAMNEIAEREKFVVLYPEQLRRSNQSNCWNWFDPAHQSRGAGEPAMIAALTRSVAEQHGVDSARIYVAGLSAGGAMAALVGKLYPEIVAAVGIHSGLAPQSANDVMSAFKVMSNGPKSASSTQSIGRPLIVFQGDADRTVASSNADAIVEAELVGLSSKGVLLDKTSTKVDASSGGRSASKDSWISTAGSPVLERWTIAGAGHAWSGGSAKGSYTDAAGPSASEALIRFFGAQRNS